MEALTSALPGGPSTADYAFLQEMCQRPNEEGELERGAPAPAAARLSAFPHFGKKIERQAAPWGSRLFFAEEIPSCAGAFGKASAMGRVWNSLLTQ